MEKCLECGYECKDVFQHVRNKHKMTNLEYKLKHNLYGNCLLCGEQIKRGASKFCCEEHKRVYSSREKFKGCSQDEYVICKICGFYGGDIGPHIRDYHKITLNEYYEKYSATTKDIYSISKLQKMSERVKGDKNPGFKHGGKLSPFSKNFIKYDNDNMSEQEKENIIYTKEKEKGLVARKNQNSSNQIGYWIKKGFTEEEAIKKVSERQKTFTLEKCIERYGEDEGAKRWKERQNKWQKTLTSKPEEEIDRINRSKFKNSGYSMISQELFWKLLSLVSKDFNSIYFAEYSTTDAYNIYNHKEYSIFYDQGKIIFLDFFIKDINKAIEFDGDYWHGEKRGNQERDAKRDDNIIKQGIKLYHVKERDYKNDPDKTIQECLNFIYG